MAQLDTDRKDFFDGTTPRCRVERRRAREHQFLVASAADWFFFYLATLVALVLTRNPVLFPTVVLVGSFMIPVAYVAFFHDLRHQSQLTIPIIARSFIYGGLFGVLAASLLEPLFIRRLDFATAFVVGLIEEFVKILGILFIARQMRHDAEMDGLPGEVAALLGPGLDVLAGQALVGIIGFFILRTRWREAKRLQTESLAITES